ncbi:6-bladed beta-propeller [Gracilimonas tropica]|uniref:6-bladed beta-propeller n=1 Tax=Gracilimonas tropica TaxID=454600 RepID=UPI000361DFA8|nr:6-bladed beta-propeller [Gracilimonas tropica]
MRKIIPIIVLLLFNYSCTKSTENQDELISINDENGKTLFLEKQRTITLEHSEQNSIGTPLYRVEFNSEDNLFFFNTINSSFLIYDKEGRLINSFGRTGRGPNEFELVYAYTIDENNNIYVYDDSQRLIKIFDNEYNLQKSVEVNNSSYFVSSHDLKVLGSNLMMGIIQTDVVSSRMESGLLIQSPPLLLADKYDLKPQKTIGKYDPYLKGIESTYNRPLFDIDRENSSVLLSHQNSYRFQEYDIESGKRLAYFGVRSESFGEGNERSSAGDNSKERYMGKISESSTEKIFYTDSYIGSFFINGTESWFDSKDLSDLNYHISIYSRDNYHLIDVLSSEYRLIGVNKNELYFIEDEDPLNFRIGVYKIKQDA